MHTGKIVSLASVGLVLGALAAGCASLASAGSAGQCIGPACQPLDGGNRDQYVHDVVLPEAAPDGALSQNPLCGSGCLPDDARACAVSPEGGTDAVPDAFMDGAGSPADAGGAEASFDASVMPVDAGSESGEAGLAPNSGSAVQGCHVRRVGTGPAAVCETAGTGLDGDPCLSSGDCAPAYGCVSEGGASVCRPFCCKGNDSCASPDTFCAERPLKDDADPTPLKVPVCVPADHCSLVEPWPCTSNNPEDCTCKDPTTACQVVRDGLTSCVPPGSGHDGDPCPCAWGYVCSHATNTCLKICSTSGEPGCPKPYKCQASSFMPDYFGVCAGTSLDDGGAP